MLRKRVLYHLRKGGERLPKLPPYGNCFDCDVVHFLQPHDTFKMRRGVPFNEISASDWADIAANQSTLYIMGFVEYVDVFDRWHRAGYARRLAYNRANPEDNNLELVTGRAAYSYDVAINPRDRLTRDYDPEDPPEEN